jgi:hypothetical protein
MDGDARQYTFWPTTPEYLSMLEINPIAGRVFTGELVTDEYLANQQWLQLMGLGDSYQQFIGY